MNATDYLLTIAHQANDIRRLAEIVEQRDVEIARLHAALDQLTPVKSDLPEPDSSATLSADGQTNE